MRNDSTINELTGFEEFQNPEVIFPNKIFGRNSVQEILQKDIQDFIGGKKGVVQVSGAAGVGKSFIVKSICKKFDKCTFYAGKFEQLQRGIPFVAIRQIFENAIRSIQNHELDQVEWKTEFAQRFEPYQSELVAILPSIEKIFDKEVKVESMQSPIEIRNKIGAAFSDLTDYILEKSNHYLIFYIENLQWADNDSLSLIEKLIIQEKPNLLFIVSNRLAHVNLSGLELNEFFVSVENAIGLSKINVEALSKEELKGSLEIVFSKSTSNIEQLADLSYEHSDGNPYILHEFLASLSRSHDLNYDFTELYWYWNLDSAVGFPSKSSLPRLLKDKLENLKDANRIIIQFSSCFGSNLNIPFISRITKIDSSEIQKTFREAVNLGFLVPADIEDEFTLTDLNNFKFSHDNIQEAVHDSFNEKQRIKTHSKIAEYYLGNSLTGLDSRDVFECAYHLNESISEDSTFEEELVHVEVNLKAAEKSLLTASFSLAFRYLQQAMDSNLHHNWESAYNIAAKTRIQGYQIARLTNNHSLANKLYSQGISHCKELDLAYLRFSKVCLDIQYGELRTALENGIVALKELGIHLPNKAGIFTVIKEFVRTKWMLGNKTDEELYQLPDMKNDKIKFAMRVMIWLLKSAYYLNPELSGVISLKLLQLSLKHGTCAESSEGFMAYGILSAAGSNNYKKTYEFCSIGAKLAEKYKVDSCSQYFGQAVYKAYKFPLRDTVDLYRKAVEKGFEDGDFLGSAEPTVNESLTYFSAGYPLEIVEQKVLQSAVYCGDLKMKDYCDFQVMMLSQIRLLRGVKVAKEEESKVSQILKNTEYKFTVTVHKMFNLQRLCLDGSWDQAAVQLADLEKEVQSMTGLYIQTEYYFYRTLILLMNAKNSSLGKKVRIKREVRSILNKMTKWSDSAPSNHQHKLLLIKGLVEENKGDLLEAKHFYINSANLAFDGKFIQNAALSYMFLAEISSRMKDEKNARLYRDKSVNLFKEWGTV